MATFLKPSSRKTTLRKLGLLEHSYAHGLLLREMKGSRGSAGATGSKIFDFLFKAIFTHDKLEFMAL